MLPRSVMSAATPWSSRWMSRCCCFCAALWVSQPAPLTKFRLKPTSTKRTPRWIEPAGEQAALAEFAAVGLAQRAGLFVELEGVHEVAALQAEAFARSRRRSRAGAASPDARRGNRRAPCRAELSRRAARSAVMSAGAGEAGGAARGVGEIDVAGLRPEEAGAARGARVADEDVGGHAFGGGLALVRDDGADATDRPRCRWPAAGVHAVGGGGVLVDDVVIHRADRHEAVGHLREPRQMLAELRVGDGGVDAVVVASRRFFLPSPRVGLGSKVSICAMPPPSQMKMQCSALPSGTGVALARRRRGAARASAPAASEARVRKSRRVRFEEVSRRCSWDEDEFRREHQRPDDVFHALAPVGGEARRRRVAGADDPSPVHRSTRGLGVEVVAPHDGFRDARLLRQFAARARRARGRRSRRSSVGDEGGALLLARRAAEDALEELRDESLDRLVLQGELGEGAVVAQARDAAAERCRWRAARAGARWALRRGRSSARRASRASRKSSARR